MLVLEAYGFENLDRKRNIKRINNLSEMHLSDMILNENNSKNGSLFEFETDRTISGYLTCKKIFI